MPDSNTTSPSDPGQPGQGPGSDPVWQADSPPPGADGPGAAADQPHKLKLKKLLTPLSPHLKAPREHHDADPDAEQEHFESPHAVPVEPEPPPPEPEPRMTAPTGPGFDQPLPDPAEPSAAAPDDPEAAAEAEPAVGEPAPAANGKAGKTIRRAAPPARRRPVVPALPVVLLLAVVLVLYLLFDPFGDQAPEATPAGAGIDEAGRPIQLERNQQIPLTDAELRTHLQQMTLVDFLGQLEEVPVHVSRQPPGVFIGGAFIPLGQSVNPDLGLTLAQVLDDAIVLTDATGAEHRLTVD